MSVFLGSAYAELDLDLAKFRQGFKDAKSELKLFGQDIASVASGLQSAGKSLEGAGKKLTKSVTAPIVAFGAAAVKTTADFDSSMSQVYATMGDKAKEMTEYNGKTMSSMEALRDYAQEMGSKTKFTASQAADALNYMALAGYNAQTSMKMLPNVLNLAAAGNMDLATASDMVTDTQTAFGMSLDRTTQVVDEMAKAASTGNTSVEQLGEAFLTVGGLVQEMNGGMVKLKDGTMAEVDNVQELEIALTAMANAGIKGSEAGTHMRNMLLKLSSPTAEGTERLKQLGVSVFDAEGNMRSLADIMTDLNGAFDNLSQEEKLKAISDLFNTRDTAAAEALLKAVGDDWNYIGEEILNAGGAASTMADTQLDNLNGQLTILKSGIEGLLIQIGDMLMPYLKKITEAVQRLVDYLRGLDEQQKQQIAKWLAIAAAIGPILLVVGKIVSGIGGMIALVSKLEPLVVGLAKGFGLVGAEATGMSAVTGALSGLASAAAPILGVVAAIAAVSVALKKLYDQGGQFTKSVNSFIMTIKKDIKAVADYLVPIFKPMLDGFKAGFDTLKETAGGILESIDGPMSRVVDTIHRIHDAITPIVSFLGTVLRPILVVLSFEIERLLAMAMGLINGVIKAIGPLIDVVSSAVNVILDVIQVFISYIKGIFTGDFSDFKEAVKNLGSDILELISNIIRAIWEFISGYFETFGSTMKGYLDTLLYNLGYWLGTVIQKVIDMFVSIKEDGPKKVKEIWANLKNAVKNFPENFVKWLKSFPKKIDDFIPKMKKAGKELMTGWWDGLKEAWEKIKKWFEGVIDTVKSFLKGITDGMKDASSAKSNASGSHAGGLAYVPYDGYIAQLHEGERVLTRNEAEAYNSGNAGAGGGYVFNYYSPKAIDPYEANKLFKESVRKMEEGFT